MKISRITNYKELKQEKKRLKETLEVNEALIKADVAALKSSFSFFGLLRGAGGYLMTDSATPSRVMNTGFTLGMQVLPFFFRRKRAAKGLKYMLIERATLALAPKLLNLASGALLKLLSKTTPDNVPATPAPKTEAVVKTTYPEPAEKV